jgi:hypothetical protein
MVDINKKFLDYDGLSTLWGIIKGKFAAKDSTISNLSVAYDNAKKQQSIIATLADGQTTKSVVIPNASESQPGLMSAEHYSTIETLSSNIQDMAPLASLQLKDSDGNAEDMVIDNRKTAFELKYEKDNDKAYIALIDANYPNGTWTEKTAADYNASTKGDEWTSYNDGGTTKYYVWSVAGQKGPQTNSGKPILKKAVSKIDVTELLKTGLLAASDVVIRNGKTQIELGFYVTDNSGAQTVEYQYIDVTDLVEVYIPGEGISITQINADPDNVSTSTTIGLNYATDSTRGALRTGYTAAATATRHYAVKLTTDGDAYVAVPWDTHEVSVINGSNYISVVDNSVPAAGEDGSKKHTHSFMVDVADSVKNSAELAKTAAQGITGETNFVTATSVPLGTNGDEGKNWTIGLADGVKTSLGYANSAVQSITSNDTNAIVVTKKNSNPGAISYEIGLGSNTIASLGKADSALQLVNILGTELKEANTTLTVNDAVKALTLGSASHTNAVGDFTNNESVSPWDPNTSIVNVPTVDAVKTYVNSVKTGIETAYGTLVSNAIGNLDSSITIDSVSRPDIGTAKQIFTKIEIVDGKLDKNKSTVAPIVISDISDFAALTTADIENICK